MGKHLQVWTLKRNIRLFLSAMWPVIRFWCFFSDYRKFYNEFTFLKQKSLKLQIKSLISGHRWCFDSVYRWGLEKKDPCILMFSMKCSSHVECPPSGAKSGKHGGHKGVPFLFFFIELGPICNYMAASLWGKSYNGHDGGLWNTFKAA